MSGNTVFNWDNGGNRMINNYKGRTDPIWQSVKWGMGIRRAVGKMWNFIDDWKGGGHGGWGSKVRSRPHGS